MTVVSTNGQLAEQATFKAAPEFYQRRGALTAQRPPPSRPCRWWCWSASSASASEIVAGALQDHKRHHHGQPGRPSAKGSVQTVRPLGPRHGHQADHGALLRPAASRSGQGHRARRRSDRNGRGDVYASLRMREADLEKHLTSGQGEVRTRRARKRARKPQAPGGRVQKPSPSANCEFGSDKDFQLAQALEPTQGTHGGGQQD